MEKSASPRPVMLLGLGSPSLAAAVHSAASHNFHCTHAVCLACLPPASEYCVCTVLRAWGDMMNTRYSTVPHFVWFCPLSWQSECCILFRHHQIWVLPPVRLVPLALRVCFFTSICDLVSTVYRDDMVLAVWGQICSHLKAWLYCDSAKKWIFWKCIYYFQCSMQHCMCVISPSELGLFCEHNVWECSSFFFFAFFF